MLIDEVKCAFDTTNVLNLHSFDIIHLTNILTDVSNEYGIESSELIYSLCGEKKMISMTVKEQRQNPSSGVERTNLSTNFLVTLSLLPRKKLLCETLKLVPAIFYQIFIFSSNDRPSKTIKNVFYFI